MADIITMGGQTGGSSSLMKDLLPVVAVLGLGYVLYSMFMQPAATSGGSAGNQGANNQVNQENTPTQGSQNQNSANSPANTQPQFDTTSQNANTLNSIIHGVVGIKSSSLQPGQYTLYPGGPVQTGSGIGNLFVTTGPGTSNALFPMGPIVTTSRDTDTAEQAIILNNLVNSQASQNIQGAWWQPAKVANLPGGYNSAGSAQSNIPVGINHCKCPHPGCGPNDDWTYC